MNIFIIPSWYPTSGVSNSGRFFREQAELYAKHFPEDQLGIVHWGQNDPRLLLSAKTFLTWPAKVLRKRTIEAEEKTLAPNLTEYFQPAFSWTRKLWNGNIGSIIENCSKALRLFESQCGKIDVLHAHVAFPAGYVAREISKRHKIPYLVMENMSPFPMKGLLWNFDKYCLGPLKEANQVIAVSQKLQKRMQQDNIDSVVCGNYIDDQFFTILTRERQKNARLLCVGRLESQKGHDVLIDACKKLKRKDYQLTIIGDGTLRDKLQQQIHNSKLQNQVILVGEKGKNEIRDELSRSDAFLFPSRHESFGIAPLEALACGVPVIGTEVGEVGNMITEDTGIKLKGLTSKKVAAALEQFLQHRELYDRDRVRSSYEKKYASAKMMKNLRSIYGEVLLSRKQ